MVSGSFEIMWIFAHTCLPQAGSVFIYFLLKCLIISQELPKACTACLHPQLCKVSLSKWLLSSFITVFHLAKNVQCFIGDKVQAVMWTLRRQQSISNLNISLQYPQSKPFSKDIAQKLSNNKAILSFQIVLEQKALKNKIQ